MVILEITVVKRQREREGERERDYIIPVRGERESDREIEREWERMTGRGEGWR